MKVKSFMTGDVAVCRPGDTMAVAARIMWERDCGVVPVVDNDGRVAGVVTDRDLCMAALIRDQGLMHMPVHDAMAKDVHCCGPGDDEAKVHAKMREHRVRRLPVVDAEGRLAGMVSLNDLALHAATSKGAVAEKRRREVFRTLAEVSRHREMAGTE